MLSNFKNETLLVTKFSSRLIMLKVPPEKFLRMSDSYWASSNLRFCFVFHNNAPQSKAVTVNNGRKIFSFLMCPSWCRRSSAPMHTFVWADMSIVSVSCLPCLLSSVLYFKTLWKPCRGGQDRVRGSCAFPLISTSQTFITLREIFYDRFGSTVVIHFCLEKYHRLRGAFNVIQVFQNVLK